ncbi:MAG TPA: hypothetical protein VER32_09990 [Pyrinomonadaceae bacterium]|nr:hypothetical protein [Pyrinomonadaceae bacterium]
MRECSRGPHAIVARPANVLFVLPPPLLALGAHRLDLLEKRRRRPSGF